MLLKNNQIVNLDTLCYFVYYPTNINKVRINSGVTINHLKINEDNKYQHPISQEQLLITSKNVDGSNKSIQEIYYMLAGWDSSTLLNAQFTKDLEGGSISGDGSDIVNLVIKRLSPDTKYKIYETIGTVPFKSGETTYFRDYLIESGRVYLYSVQPQTVNQEGQIQSKIAGLNDYQYSWIIDEEGNQLRIANSEITNTIINTKDATIETIGGEFPFVNRYSSLNYKTFTLSGTIATELDIDQDFTIKATEDLYGGVSEKEDISTYNLVKLKFLEKYGQEPTVHHNAMSIDSAHERLFRDKVLNMFKDGRQKIYKSDTEGIMLVKFSGLNIIPKTVLGRVLYDFSVTVTEIGEVTSEIIQSFTIANKVPHFNVPTPITGETSTEYEERYDREEFMGC